MSNNRHQISPIPPHPYGERFLNFMTGITMTKEEAERRAHQERGQVEEVNAHNNMHHHHIPPKSSTDGAGGYLEVPPHRLRNDHDVEKTLDAAEKSTDKQTGPKGRRRSEEEKPDRTLLTHANEREGRTSTTLPMVQEAKENSSHHSSSHRNSQNGEMDERDEKQHFPDADGHLDEPNQNSNHKDMQQVKDGYFQDQNHEASQNHTIEYTVSAKDEDGEKQKYQMEAPLDSRSQGHLDVEPEHDSHSEAHVDPRPEPERRISKPPRIGSGIIPTLTPLLREDEIGIAR